MTVCARQATFGFDRPLKRHLLRRTVSTTPSTEPNGKGAWSIFTALLVATIGRKRAAAFLTPLATPIGPRGVHLRR